MTAEEIQNSHDFNFTKRNTNNIMVIGVGGGGNNAVNHMYNEGIRNVTFVVANTDKQDLDNSPVPIKVLMGPGLGAGNNPEVGRKYAEESVENIERLFDEVTDMVFITAGMGGGTGTGASPVVARVAREKGLLTVGIITIPFLFEGERKILKALKGADELGKYVDALLVINNDRLAEIYSDFDFLNAYAKADDTLLTAAQSISEIITIKGYMNLDFKDVDTTLRNGGTAIISTGYGEGPKRVTKAIEDALHSPLLKNTDVFGSKRLLFNIYFSPKAEQPFIMEETKELTSFVSNIDSDVDVIWGATFDESLGNKVKITILATGFDVTVNDNISTHIKPNPENTGETTGPDESKKGPNVAENVGKEVVVPKEEKTSSDEDRIAQEYGHAKVEELRKAGQSMRYIILRPDQLDDDAIIQALSGTPTLGRSKEIISSIKTAGCSSSAQQQPAEEAEHRLDETSAEEPQPKPKDKGKFISFM